MNEVVTDWSYALAEFLVSSLFRAFLFLAILAMFTLQMFFSFDYKIDFIRFCAHISIISAPLTDANHNYTWIYWLCTQVYYGTSPGRVWDFP